MNTVAGLGNKFHLLGAALLTRMTSIRMKYFLTSNHAYTGGIIVYSLVVAMVRYELKHLILGRSLGIVKGMTCFIEKTEIRVKGLDSGSGKLQVRYLLLSFKHTGL